MNVCNSIYLLYSYFFTKNTASDTFLHLITFRSTAMEKFLFTDGKNEVREVQSLQELQELIRTVAEKNVIRIWLFNTCEWKSYAAFTNYFPACNTTDKKTMPVSKARMPATAILIKPKPRRRIIRKLVLYGAIGTAIFLVYNFTRINRGNTDTIHITSVRPDNVPVMDIDSLITGIELSRGKKIDKDTRYNLRLRNKWPEYILLTAEMARDSSSSGNKYYNVHIKVDNTASYKLDNAIVQFTVWKNNAVRTVDTLQFGNIRYGQILEKELPGAFRGDSITVAFQSIEASAFNFCYAADKENISGNYNDRWFCRE